MEADDTAQTDGHDEEGSHEDAYVSAVGKLDFAVGPEDVWRLGGSAYVGNLSFEHDTAASLKALLHLFCYSFVEGDILRATDLEERFFVFFILELDEGWASGDLLSEAAVIQKLFAERLKSFVGSYDLCLQPHILLPLGDYCSILYFIHQFANCFTVVDDFRDDVATEFHLVYDLDGLDVEVIPLLLSIPQRYLPKHLFDVLVHW